jgi:site-specific recombinase XerD
MKKRTRPSLQELLDGQIKQLATVLRPGTIEFYQCAAKSFLSYLQSNWPRVRRLSQLLRDPHILGWLRSLHEQKPPLANKTRMERIINVRRLLRDLEASRDPPRPDLFATGDYPPHDHYLPKPLSPEDDQKLQRRLHKRETLRSKGLLLLRATGMRIGECLQLTADSLRELGQNQWAVRVPLGKLHTERWVPVDDDTCRIFHAIKAMRPWQAPDLATTPGLLLLQKNGTPPSYLSMRHELITAAREAGCSIQPTLHQLRHTYATELLRAGASLPAVKELLGHRTIEMTLRYVQVSQIDLQREYHQARQKMGSLHVIPKLQRASGNRLQSLQELLDEARHGIEMWRRRITDEKAKRKLARLINRLSKISAELSSLDEHEK